MIDDDEDDRLLFRLALEETDRSVRFATAQNDKQVRELLKDESDLPDLIFLDLNMPVKSGWEFLAEFKDHPVHRDIPVIIYSTSSSRRDIARARELNALCFLVKPDDFSDLKRFLEVVVNKSKADLLSELRKASSGTCHILV